MVRLSIVDHLGRESPGQPVTVRAQEPPELYEPCPDHDVPDAVYSD